MFCHNCGLEVDDKTTVCPACATVLQNKINTNSAVINNNQQQSQQADISSDENLQASSTFNNNTDTQQDTSNNVLNAEQESPSAPSEDIQQNFQTPPQQTQQNSQSIPPQETQNKIPSQNFQPTKPIPNYLVWSILCTVFCCLPFGIVGLIYSNKVTNCLLCGQVQEALSASKNAKTWNTVGTILGVIAAICYAVIFVFLGFSF